MVQFLAGTTVFGKNILLVIDILQTHLIKLSLSDHLLCISTCNATAVLTYEHSGVCRICSLFRTKQLGTYITTSDPTCACIRCWGSG
jgi:hypothetical protein